MANEASQETPAVSATAVVAEEQKGVKRQHDEAVGGDVAVVTTEASESGHEESAVKKQRVEETAAGDVPAPPKSASVDIHAVRKQVEYYLSDENLAYDRFFHEILSKDPEMKMNFAQILSCKKIQAMGCTAEDIEEALQASALEVVKDEASGSRFIKRSSPLPELKARETRQRKPVTELVDQGKGCVIKVSGLPEDCSWEDVKKSFLELLPEAHKEKGVWFVSYIKDAVSYVLAKSFDGDAEFFAEKKEALEINNAKLTLEVLTADSEECKTVLFRLCPLRIRQAREDQTLRRQKGGDRPARNERSQRDKEGRGKSGGVLKGKPLVIGEVRFNDVDHLRQCLREVLFAKKGDTAEGESKLVPVSKKVEPVLRGLLSYHPKSEQKLKDVVSFAIGDAVLTPDKNNDRKGRGGGSTKCFHVVRTDGTNEDFSFLKCLNEMIKNPPYAVPAETATAAPTETAAKPETATAAPAETATVAPAESVAPAETVVAPAETGSA